MDIQINTYQNFTNPSVVETIPIRIWLNNITSSTYSEKILYARHHPEEYDIIKKNLPCVTYNFRYRDYKQTDNTIQSTGVIYIDIDNPSFDITVLDKNKILSYYHSFGGHGYAILVKVSGVTIQNFSSTYSHIVQDLGIEEYVDRQAAKATQFNVLSYDSNLFINETSYTYTGIPAPLSMVYNKKNTYTIDGVAKSNIRFDNLNEIEVNGDYVMNWEGFDYIRCFIPVNKVKKGYRNQSLITYCNNLVYLNPLITYDRVFKIMNAVNERMCDIPLEESQIHSIIKSMFKYLGNGTLTPKYHNKKRKIVFNQNSSLTKDEKLDICRKEIAQHRRDKSMEKLYQIIENWDYDKYGKITQRAVFLNHPISKKTVGKYWYEVKEFVSKMNNQSKTIN